MVVQMLIKDQHNISREIIMASHNTANKKAERELFKAVGEDRGNQSTRSDKVVDLCTGYHTTPSSK